jgi:hypothetical protein
MLLEAITDCLFQKNTTLPLCVSHGAVVDTLMKKVMANQFVLKCLKCVPHVGPVAPMKAIPIDQVCSTCAATSPLVRCHLFESLEAMQITSTIDGRALDV